MPKNIQLTLLNRYEAIVKPLEKLSEDIQRIKNDYKIRDKQISDLAREKLKKGEISLQQIAQYIIEERKKPRYYTHPKDFDYQYWENEDFFEYSLRLANNFARRDIHPQYTTLNQEVVTVSIKKLDSFLKRQSISRQTEILHYLLENLIYQQQLVGYLETLSLFDKENRNYLSSYDTGFEFYTSFESLLKETMMQDPKLYFPFIQFANTVKEGLKSIIDSVEYDFDRYYQNVNYIFQLRRFKKKLIAKDHKLIEIIEFLLNFLRCKISLEKLNYIKSHYSPILKKYSEYMFHLVQTFSYPHELLSLQIFFICLDLSKSHFSFSSNLRKFKNCKLMIGNFFDKQLYDINSNITQEGILIGNAYRRCKVRLEEIYLYCKKNLKELQRENKYIPSHDEKKNLHLFLEQGKFQPSLESYNSSLFNLEFVNHVFKQEYEKRKIQIPQSDNSTSSFDDLQFSLRRNEREKSTQNMLQKDDKKSCYLQIENPPKTLNPPEDILKDPTEDLDSTPWQEVPLLRIDRFKKKCPFNYHSRVKRWWNCPLDNTPLPESLFPEYKDKSPEKLYKSKLFHSLPQEVDNYLKMGKEISHVGSLHPLKSGNEVAHHCYSFIALPAKISHESQIHYGLILYKINTERRLIVHRYFHESSSANELLQTFMLPEKVLAIINALVHENAEEVAERGISSQPSNVSTPSYELQTQKESHSLLIQDPRGFEIELYSTKM